MFTAFDMQYGVQHFSIPVDQFNKWAVDHHWSLVDVVITANSVSCAICDEDGNQAGFANHDWDSKYFELEMWEPEPMDSSDDCLNGRR